MNSGRVAGFSAAAGGFAFANAFPSVPLLRIPIPAIGDVPLGDAANGLCGGMAFAAADLHAFGIPPATLASDAVPGEGTPLFNYLVDRLVASFDLPRGLARYCEWMALPDEDQGPIAGVAQRTRAGWPDIQRVLDHQDPAPLGLVRVHSTDLRDLGKNHQVLAFGYDLDPATSGLTLYLYDPNVPRQDVRMSCCLDPAQPLGLTYSAGQPPRGFFRTPYAPRDPRPALISRPAVPWFVRLFGWLRGSPA